MTCLDASARDESAEDATPPDATATVPLQERLRADLGALCLHAHEDAIDRLVDTYRRQRPARAVIRDAYWSLRRLRRAESALAARFADCALHAREPEALLRAYDDAVTALALRDDMRDALLGALRGRMRAELTACLRAWCESVRARVRATTAVHAAAALADSMPDLAHRWHAAAHA